YNQQQKQEQSGPATEPNSPAAARARPSDCSKPSSRTRAQSLPQNCISQHRVLTNSANATASGSSNDSHCPALAKSCTPNGSPSASPPSPMSAAPRWPPVGLPIQQETTDCGRVHSACLPASSVGRQRLPRLRCLIGMDSGQTDPKLIDIRRSICRRRRSAVRRGGGGSGGGLRRGRSGRRRAAAVDGNADVPAVSLRRPGSGQFVPEDLVSMAKADWLTDRLLRAANSQPDADCTTADRLCQAMIRLDADLCGAAGQSAWTLRAATTGAVGSACLISGDGSRCCLMQIGNSAAVIGSRSAPLPLPPTPKMALTASTMSRRPGDGGSRSPSRPLRMVGKFDEFWPSTRHPSAAPCSPATASSAAWRRSEPSAWCMIEVGIDPAADRFIILGSPGLWDRLSPQQAVACVGGQLLAAQSQGSNPSGENLAATLVQLAESCGHRDSAAGFNEARLGERGGVRLYRAAALTDCATLTSAGSFIHCLAP
uniref:PPM-type phosphatase domain-containing protein n=1 Tax=Macrostomum lignano TaxID=282301 RepID=A0A1I8F3J8_9PLAT